jgi:hypothetical protein
MNTCSPQADPTVDHAAAVEALYTAGHALHTQDCHRDAVPVFRLMILAAPRDERGWVALADCHSKLGQPRIALELYAMGCVAAAPAPRCELARARALRLEGRDDEADVAVGRARAAAEKRGDEDLLALIEREQGATS